MSEYEDKDDLWVWEYGCKATLAQMNEAHEYCKSQPESRELHRLRWKMDWLIRHGSVEQVEQCADAMHILELTIFKKAKNWCGAHIEMPGGL